MYGAGVLGTLYAARLSQSGQDVTLLAREQRLGYLQDYALILENIVDGKPDTVRVHIVEELTSQDRYDIVLVIVRKNQVESVLPRLAGNVHVPAFLFFHNNAEGPDAFVTILGRERVLFGFPGASGSLEGGVVRYCLIPQEATTLGEIGGSIMPRLRRVANVFQQAGFPVCISRHMDAWLRTHAFFITAVAGALYRAEGSVSRPAGQLDVVETGERRAGEFQSFTEPRVSC